MPHILFLIVLLGQKEPLESPDILSLLPTVLMSSMQKRFVDRNPKGNQFGENPVFRVKQPCLHDG
jgi:hypothetical protein